MFKRFREKSGSNVVFFVQRGTFCHTLLGPHLTENEVGADSEVKSTHEVSSGDGGRLLSCLGCMARECINACDT